MVELSVSRCLEEGLSPFVGLREFAPTSVDEKLREAIRNSDYLLALLSRPARGSSWVNQELGTANGLGVTIVPLVEEGTTAPGFIKERDQIRFSRESFDKALDRALNFITKDRGARAPLFQVQSAIEESGAQVPVRLSVVSVTLLRSNAEPSELSREEVAKRLADDRGEDSPDRAYFLLTSAETKGGTKTVRLLIRSLSAAGWRIDDGVYYWPYILQEFGGHREDMVGKRKAGIQVGDDLSDSGLPRIQLKVTKDLGDSEGHTIRSGTTGLFVWFPETGPNGVEYVEVRLGDKTEILPLESVIAVAPPGHAEKWNETRRKILGG